MIRIRWHSVLFIAVAACTTGAFGTAIAQAQAPASIPAFPGAEGFGATTQGGRGGKVMFVTNLEDYANGEAPIPGSLRASVEAEGPRTIIFRVSGYIELKRTLDIRTPFLTIAGQTAPGDGISIKNYGIDVAASEVILRYLRVRPGDVTGEEIDAINVRSSNVIVDHCSASWATDETVSVIGEATNVTVQWCIIAESLNESVHSKGEHGYGSLISTAGDVSIHHTIYALHKSRSPRPRHTLLDFRNNVIYGWGDRAGYNEDDLTRINYVGNYLLPLGFSRNGGTAFRVGGIDVRLYVEGNVLQATDGTIRVDWELINPPEGIADTAAARVLGRSQPFAVPAVTTQEAEHAFESVLEKAGAVRPRRDAVDRRLIGMMRLGTGAIIDSQEEVGGWLALGGGAAPPDDDRDGMDDGWEDQFGLDRNDGSDHAGDMDGDGYTNLEEYLNDTNPTEAFGWLEPPRIRPSSGTVFTQPPLFVTMAPSEPGLPVYYTTDGREPTTASSIYVGPVRVYDDAHVRAISIASDRPTTSAYASYAMVRWLTSDDEPSQSLRRGLRYAVYVADDWDEGVALDDLQPVHSGIVDAVDFGVRPPDGRNAIVFDGWLEIPQDGVYAFFLRDDERSRLRLNGRDVTHGRPVGTAPGQIALRKGLYRFHLRSLHEEARNSSLEWSGPDIARGPIPNEYFFQRTDGSPGE